MKKIFLLLLVCAASLVGCKNANEPKEQTLVGKWELTEWRTSEETTYQAWTQQVTRVTFSDDDKFVAEGYFGNGSGRYERNGKYLDFYYGNNTQPDAMFIIDSLSKDELVVIFEFDYYFKFKRQ